MAIPDSPVFSLSQVLQEVGLKGGSMSLPLQTELSDNQFTLSFGWDSGMQVSADGTRLWGWWAYKMTEITMSIPFTLSTGVITKTEVDNPYTTSYYNQFNDDGTRLFSGAFDGMRQWDVPIPYDTTSIVDPELFVPWTTSVRAFRFTPDGMKFIKMVDTQSHFEEWTLISPYEITGMLLTSEYNGPDYFNFVDFDFVNGGTAIWGGGFTDPITNIPLATPYDITTIGPDTEWTEGPDWVDTAFTYYAFCTVPNQSSMMFADSTAGNLFQFMYGPDIAPIVPLSLADALAAAEEDSFDFLYGYPLPFLSTFRNYVGVPPIPPATCRDLSTFNFTGTQFKVDGTSDNIYGYRWGSDGLHSMIVRDEGGLRIMIWSTPFDIASNISNTYYGNFETSTTVRNFWVSRAGDRYVTINDSDDGHGLRHWTFPTPWNPSGAITQPGADAGFFAFTATGIVVMDENIQNIIPGSKCWVADIDASLMKQYSMSTPYDFSNMVFEGQVGTGSRVYEMVWNENGTILYMLLSDDNQIRELLCSVPFNIITGVLGATSTSGFEQTCRGLDITPVGFTLMDPEEDQWSFEYTAICP